MSRKPRGAGRRGRRSCAWALFAAAWVLMGIGLFLPSYGTPFIFSPPSAGDPGMSEHLGWECAWTVTLMWGTLLDGSAGVVGYGESLMLSYLPINVLFILAGLFLWLTGRSGRLGWVFRAVYSLIMLQVLSWWVLHVFDHERTEEILIGYWLWLGAYMLLAGGFWVMPGVGRWKDAPRKEGEEGLL